MFAVRALFAIALVAASAETATGAELAGFEDLREEHWIRHVPDVFICDDEIPTEVVEVAMNFWRSRGANFGRLERHSECPERPRFAVIAIYRDRGRAGEAYGVTARTVYNLEDGTRSNSIAYARIWIRSHYFDSTLLMKHELGHALGLGDLEASGHLMSRTGPIY